MITKQRFDLDLLRALAVIAVLLYHFKLYFPSGFIGVDIFFVLSGYLMAEAFKESTSIKDFYERRLRRILPAMLVVLFIFYLAAPFIFLPFETKIFSDTVIGTLLFSPNLIFWRDNDYFAELAFTPFLHYWSLGVELQYYIVFPFLVLLLRRKIILILAVLLLSCIASIWMTDVSSKTAFFMLPTRMWEFLSGYVAWWICEKSGVANKLSEKLYIAKIAFLLLIAACFLSIPTQIYPGLWALIPVLLSVTVIVFGRGLGSWVNSYFKYVVEWIAKISYSIYLIHFPLFFVAVYLPFNQQKDLTILYKLALIVITVVLAYLSYRYIEMPFRNRNAITLKKFTLTMSVFAFSMLGTFLFFNNTRYFINFYDAVEKPIIHAMIDRGAWRCTKLQKLKEFGEESCFLRNEIEPEKVFYLVGDSHIDALKEAFVEVSMDKNASVRLNRNRCYLGTYECGSESIKNQVEKYHITDVVLHGYTYEYFNYEDLDKLLAWALKQSIRIHILGPVPVYSEKVPYALFHEYKYGDSLLTSQNIHEFRHAIPKEYKDFKAKHFGSKNIYFYEPESVLCKPVCQIKNDVSVFYFDSHHLTIAGAKQLTPIFKEIISK